MRTIPSLTAIAAAWVSMMAAGWLPSHAVSLAGEEPKGPAELSKELAIFLGCGEVVGQGTVVQLDRTGKVLGTVELPGPPYGLAVHKDALVAAVRPYSAPGRVIRIDGKGNVETLLQDKETAPAPIAIAVDPVSGDILVADNDADVLLLLPAGQAKNARKVIQIRGHEQHLQDMSVAFAQDGYLLFGGSGPVGLYRFRAQKDTTLGESLIPAAGVEWFSGRVAADPLSRRWAATLRSELRIYQGTRELLKLPYPGGRNTWPAAVAFGPDGTLVVALSDFSPKHTRDDVALADLKLKTFHPLFSWNKSRIVSMAVGPKTTWKATTPN